MENKKDLSEAFALIFGIKPSEVPEKSSGVQKLNRICTTFNGKLPGGFDLNEHVFGEEEEPKEEELIFDFTDFQNTINQILNKDNMNKNERSKTVKETSDELNHYSQMYNSKCGDKGVEPEYVYEVLFKNDSRKVKITSNTMLSLSEYSPLTNLNANGGGLVSKGNLIWGQDEETGEMICLDSFSILAIVKIK